MRDEAGALLVEFDLDLPRMRTGQPGCPFVVDPDPADPDNPVVAITFDDFVFDIAFPISQ